MIWALTLWYAAQQERRTPAEEEADRKRRSNRRSSVKRDPIYGVRLGGKDRSYLIKNGQIDVLRNVIGGVQVSHCPVQLMGAARPEMLGKLCWGTQLLHICQPSCKIGFREYLLGSRTVPHKVKVNCELLPGQDHSKITT